MTISLLQFLNDCRQVDTHLRKGQGFFNLLHYHRPDLAQQIQGTDMDPYYKDHVPEELINWVCLNWQAKAE